MEHTTLTYNGIPYKCRVIADRNDKDTKLIVAPVALLNHLFDNTISDNFSGDEKHVDNQVCFYADPHEMQLSDQRLFEIIYS